MMNQLLFSVDGIPCALPLADVRIVIQMVQPGPARDGRPGLCGTLDYHGQIIPVWSVRAFFGRPERLPELTDQIIIVEKGKKTAALWVDEAHIPRQGPLPLAGGEMVKIETSLAAGVDLTTGGAALFRDLFLYLSQEPLPVLGRAGTASPLHGQQEEKG